MASLEFARLISLKIVKLITIAIHQHCPSGSHDGRTTIAAILLHSLATLSLPRNHSVLVLEIRDECVVKLPVVSEMISAARRRYPLRIINAQRPSADIHLVRAIIERFAGAVNLEPMPVIRMHVAPVRAARSWSLPQVPVKLRRGGNLLACA